MVRSLAVLGFMLLTTSLGAQNLRLGIVSGIQQTFYSNSNAEAAAWTYEPDNAFINGWMLSYRATDYLEIELDVINAKKHFFINWENLGWQSKHENNAISLPLTAKTTFGKKVATSLLIGGAYDFNLSQVVRYPGAFIEGDAVRTAVTTTVPEFQDELIPGHVSLVAGIGLRIPIEEHFQFYTSWRYMRSISAIYKGTPGLYQHSIVLFGITSNIALWQD